jgi:hypothetical protein
MPQIMVIADRRADGCENSVTLTERVNVTDFESEHFQGQLVERLGWAVGDADELEHDPPVGTLAARDTSSDDSHEIDREERADVPEAVMDEVSLHRSGQRRSASVVTTAS